MFEQGSLLVAAPVITAAITALAITARRRRVQAAFAWSRLLGHQAQRLGRWSPALLAGAAMAAGVGLAGPRWGSASRTAESRALNIVIVMDVSKSMLAEDVAPNRLGRAASLARRLIQDLGGDRFALVAFAGRAYLLSPLTLDESSIAVQLDAVDPEMMSAGGSGLAAALDLARDVLVKSPQGGDRAIVVFSDGESFDPPGALATAGRALARSNITLVAMPVGDVRGAKIPENGEFHRDVATGKEVITVRRDDLLQEATRAASGVFIPATTPDPVGEARRILARLKRAPATDRAASDTLPRAWIFALVALLVLLLQTLTRRTAALVAIALALAGGTATAQRPSAGSRLLSRGDTMRARAAFTAEAKSRQSDTSWFNAGTSALMAGDLPSATVLLQSATLSLDPALRQRALYNLGTAYLMLARRDTAQRDTLLASASSALREALLLAPRDGNAKFNYELTQHLKPPPKPQSGSHGPGRGQQPQPLKSPPNGGRGGMTPAEADQVLNAMERAERETRQRQNQRARSGEPSRGPDW